MNSSQANTAAVFAPFASFLLFLWRERPRLRNNPVILRELVAQLRRSGSFIQLSVFLIIAFLFLLGIWQSLLHHMQGGYARTDFPRELFFLLNISAGAILLLFVPLISATAINLERERDTWDLMASTPLTLGSILLGKLLSSILYIWLFFIALLPFYGVLFPLGGVSPQEIAFVFYLLTETVLVFSMIGLTCSMFFSKPVVSISMTYGLGLFYLFGLFILGALWMDRMDGGWFAYSLLALSPMFPLLMHLDPADSQTFGDTWIAQYPFLWHGLLAAALLALLALLCFYLLSRKNTGASGWLARPPAGDAVLPSALNQSRKGVHVYIPDHRLISDRWNPVFVKEIRALIQWPYLNLLGSIALPMLFSLLILWLIISEASIGEEMRAFHAFSLLCAILLTPLFTIPYAASAFRGERDRGYWDLLAVTTLTPNRLARGKFFAGFHLFQLRFWSFFCVFAIAATIHFIFSMPEGGRFFRATIYTSAACYACAVFYLSFGQWISLAARKTVSAYMICFATAFIHYFGVIVIVPIIVRITYHYILQGLSQQDFEVVFYLNTLSPIYLLYHLIEPLPAWFAYDWIYSLVMQIAWLLGLAAFFYWLTLRRLQRLSESRDIL